MVGQRQKVSWAAMLGHLPRLRLLLHNGSREHLSSLMAPGSWLLAPGTVLRLFCNLFRFLLNPGAKASCAHECMWLCSLTDGPGLGHTL